MTAGRVTGDDGRADRDREPRRPDVTAVEVVGGVEAFRLGLHDPDDRWPEQYQDHRRRIGAALASVDVQIEHIGSTSVAGLAAKPIIDLVVAVPDITAEEDYLDALLAAGYRLRVREPGHRLVRTPERDVHVHLYQRGDPAVAEYLLLRDHLREDAEDRALYERTKRDLLTRRWDRMDDYADAKSEVILAIKARARAREAATAREPGPSTSG
ncbi:MAG: GrpB family protein [Nocardioidaceae bacterium]|nr:GrpB family protein [Nocardioidaceae bacterium]